MCRKGGEWGMSRRWVRGYAQEGGRGGGVRAEKGGEGVCVGRGGG